MLKSKIEFNSFDDYIAAQPPNVIDILKILKQTNKNARAGGGKHGHFLSIFSFLSEINSNVV
jgi:hypothetical protein